MFAQTTTGTQLVSACLQPEVRTRSLIISERVSSLIDSHQRDRNLVIEQVSCSLCSGGSFSSAKSGLFPAAVAGPLRVTVLLCNTPVDCSFSFPHSRSASRLRSKGNVIQRSDLARTLMLRFFAPMCFPCRCLPNPFGRSSPRFYGGAYDDRFGCKYDC